MAANKTTYGTVVPHVSKFMIKNWLPCQKISRIDPRRVSNKCSPISKTFATRRNSKPATGRKTSSFQEALGKVDPESGNFICNKEVTVSKREELSTDQKIMEMLRKGAIKMWNSIS